MTLLWQSLAAVQHRRPWRFVGLAFGLGALALPWVLQLEMNSDFEAVLPESAPAVRDTDEIRARLGGTAIITLAVQATGEAPNRERMRAFVRQLAPALEARTDVSIVGVDWNVEELGAFVREHRHLYASHEDLVGLDRALTARAEWERARANPFFFDLDDETQPPDPEPWVRRLQDHAQDAQARLDRFVGGLYEHPERPMVLLFVRTSIRGGEIEQTRALLSAIEEEATRANGSAIASRTEGTDVGWVADGLRIDYGGELMDMSEENDALHEAVTRSTLITVFLLLLSIGLYFGRLRAVPLLALVLVPPCLVTFGVAERFVDYLNASSAFLGSIVVGNGVNASVMWLGRYFEERRGGEGVRSAIARAHQGTSAGTFAACVACTLAYGSLMVTDYRGFRDFGLIGAIGMLLCWSAAYLLLPALVTLTERWRPLTFSAKDRRRNGRYGRLFARLAFGSPRAVLLVCAGLSVLSVGALAVAVRGDALEYDFRNLQAQRPDDSRVVWVNERVFETVEETRTGGALFVLAPSREDVPALRERLEQTVRDQPGTMSAVRGIDDMLPPEQKANLPVLRSLRATLLELRPHLDDEMRAKLDAQLPPAELSLVGVDDLPASAVGLFTEEDGTRGRLLFVEHAEGEDTWDGRYMVKWAGATRAAGSAVDGHVAVGGGAVVFADLITSIFEDGPVVIGTSLLLTLLLTLVAFRRWRHRALALGSMVAGVLWMLGVLAALGIKLNFLNMVALPITFGIGVEYGVNYVSRFREERGRGLNRSEAARAALEGAGGAVILCSFTTLAGYLSLYTSANRALNSFGLAMSIGEVTCLLASVLALPALLRLFDGGVAKAAQVSVGTSSQAASR